MSINNLIPIFQISHSFFVEHEQISVITEYDPRLLIHFITSTLVNCDLFHQSTLVYALDAHS